MLIFFIDTQPSWSVEGTCLAIVYQRLALSQFPKMSIADQHRELAEHAYQHYLQFYEIRKLGDQINQIQEQIAKLEKVKKPSTAQLAKLTKLWDQHDDINLELMEKGAELVRNLHDLLNDHQIANSIKMSQKGGLLLQLDLENVITNPKHPQYNRVLKLYKKIMAKDSKDHDFVFDPTQNALDKTKASYDVNISRIDVGIDQIYGIMDNRLVYQSFHEIRHYLFALMRRSDNFQESIFHTSLYAASKKININIKSYQDYMTMEELYNHGRDLNFLGRDLVRGKAIDTQESLTKLLSKAEMLQDIAKTTIASMEETSKLLSALVTKMSLTETLGKLDFDQSTLIVHLPNIDIHFDLDPDKFSGILKPLADILAKHRQTPHLINAQDMTTFQNLLNSALAQPLNRTRELIKFASQQQHRAEKIATLTQDLIAKNPKKAESIRTQLDDLRELIFDQW